jgi:hypothetical protein
MREMLPKHQAMAKPHAGSPIYSKAEKSACRKLSSGIQSFDNQARDWHTPTALVPVLPGASDHCPLIADQQSLSLIQPKLFADRP